jgi:hypothetical protein
VSAGSAIGDLRNDVAKRLWISFAGTPAASSRLRRVGEQRFDVDDVA